MEETKRTRNNYNKLRHYRYEFVFQDETSVVGWSLRDLFDNLPEGFIPFGVSVKMKVKQVLKAKNITITDEIPDDVDKAIEFLFFELEFANLGSFKWFDSLIGPLWRFDPGTNSLKRRTGLTGRPHKMSLQGTKTLLENLEKANEVRKRNPEMVHLSTQLGGTIGLLSISPEEREERAETLKAKKKEYWDSLSAEARAKYVQRINEGRIRALKRKTLRKEVETIDSTQRITANVNLFDSWQGTIEIGAISCVFVLESTAIENEYTIKWDKHAYELWKAGRDWLDMNVCDAEGFCVMDSRSAHEWKSDVLVKAIYDVVKEKCESFWNEHPLTNYEAGLL